MSKWKTPEPKIGDQAARDQVQILVSYYGIDPTAKSTADAAESSEFLLEELVRFVRLGWIEINPDATVIQHLQTPPDGNADPNVKYRRIRGEDTVNASKNVKSDDYAGKTLNLMAALSDVGDAGMRKITGSDLRVVEVLGAVFFSR